MASHEGELSDPGLAGECCFRFTLTGVEGEEQPNPVPSEPPINVLGYLVTYRQFTHTVGNCEYKPGSICDLLDWIVEKGGTCHTFAGSMWEVKEVVEGDLLVDCVGRNKGASGAAVIWTYHLQQSEAIAAFHPVNTDWYDMIDAELNPPPPDPNGGNGGQEPEPPCWSSETDVDMTTDTFPVVIKVGVESGAAVGCADDPDGWVPPPVPDPNDPDADPIPVPVEDWPIFTEGYQQAIPYSMSLKECCPKDLVSPPPAGCRPTVDVAVTCQPDE